MAAGVINSFALLENFVWKVFYRGFFNFYGGSGDHNLYLMATSTARYHCIYMKWDDKGVISSLKSLVMFFKDCLFKESMLLCKKFILFGIFFFFLIWTEFLSQIPRYFFRMFLYCIPLIAELVSVEYRNFTPRNTVLSSL